MKKALLAYVLITVIGVMLIPLPPAMACDYRCAVDVCRTPAGQEGFWKMTYFDNQYVLLSGTRCTGSVHYSLYSQCEEFPCGGKASGTLFHIEEHQVSIFSVRNEEEAKEITDSIEKYGLKKTKENFNVKTTIPAIEFTQYYNKLHSLKG